jgi:hypothetical protein
LFPANHPGDTFFKKSARNAPHYGQTLLNIEESDRQSVFLRTRRQNTAFSQTSALRLYRLNSRNLPGDIFAFETARAKLQGQRCSTDFRFHRMQIRLPRTAGMVLRMTHFIARHNALSTNITFP